MASQSVGDGQTYTVAVIRQSDKTTVGHTSYNLAPTVLRFLALDCSRGIAVRGAGYGMEVPYTYSASIYVDRAKEEC